MIENDRILLVEDDALQVQLIRQVLTASRVTNRVLSVGSGEEALDYLSGKGNYSDRVQYPLPSLVLLDLKLPKISGFEVLSWIRKNPVMNRLPVVVLTGSAENGDIERAYNLGANSYLVKPFEMEDLRALVKSINAYWVILAQTPQI
jgi:CheY-like chemotaxis protein